MSSTTKITLKSSDGKTFEVDEAVALESETIKLLKGDSDNREFHLENVTGEILEKVIEYCKKHVEAAENWYPNEWDYEFLDDDVPTCFAFLRAANYLKIKSLLDLTCNRISFTVAMTPVDRTWRNFVQNNINGSLLVEDEARKIESMVLREVERLKLPSK